MVAFVASLFGWGGGRSVVVQGVKVRKSGKIIMIVAAIMILGGLSWAGSGQQLYGYTLAGYGLLFFIVGKIVAWFQKM